MLLIILLAVLGLDDPYEPLRAKDYDLAIARFEQAVAAEPTRADLRKDLGYTLLKIGETVQWLVPGLTRRFLS